MEFDPTVATTESTMVRYFENSLKPTIKVEINQNATYLDNYKELLVKAVRTKAKAGLRSSSYMQEINQ